MINLTCLTSGGNPPPEVAWYKNNIKLQVNIVMMMMANMIITMVKIDKISKFNAVQVRATVE